MVLRHENSAKLIFFKCSLGTFYERCLVVNKHILFGMVCDELSCVFEYGISFSQLSVLYIVFLEFVWNHILLGFQIMVIQRICYENSSKNLESL